MTAFRRSVLAGVLVLGLAATASCAERGPERTATAEQALAEVQIALRSAEQALGAPVSSEVPEGPMRTDCSDPVDGGPAGRVYWAAYYGTGPPGAGSSPVLPPFDQLVPRMQGLGWTVTVDRRSSPGDAKVVFARPSTVELTLSFAGRPDVGFDVTASTSCVWPTGVRP